jgi:hypothetical protein
MQRNNLLEKAARDHHTICCINQYCVLCGFHVSGYNCNADLISERPEAADWDWWLACDNAECIHSYGEGLFQIYPDWVIQK